MSLPRPDRAHPPPLGHLPVLTVYHSCFFPGGVGTVRIACICSRSCRQSLSFGLSQAMRPSATVHALVSRVSPDAGDDGGDGGGGRVFPLFRALFHH